MLLHPSSRSSLFYFLVECIIYQSVLDQEIITHEIYYLHFIKLCKQDSPNFIKTAIVPDGTYLTSFNYTIGCP